MRIKKIDKTVKAAAGGPLVAATYYVLGFSIRYVSCLPRFADTEFAGIPVTQFLLLALTGAALLLCAFAALGGLRLVRQGRRMRGESARVVKRWGWLAFGLGVATFGAVVAAAGWMVDANCR